MPAYRFTTVNGEQRISMTVEGDDVTPAGIILALRDAGCTGTRVWTGHDGAFVILPDLDPIFDGRWPTVEICLPHGRRDFLGPKGDWCASTYDVAREAGIDGDLWLGDDADFTPPIRRRS